MSQTPAGDARSLSRADVGEAVDKLENLARENPDQARSAIDKVEDVINDRTGGKFSDLVERGGDFVEDRLGLPDQTTDQGTDPGGTPDPVDNPNPGPVDPAEVPGPTPDQPPADPIPAPDSPPSGPGQDQPAPADPDADPTTGTDETGPAQDGDILGSDRDWQPGQ